MGWDSRVNAAWSLDNKFACRFTSGRMCTFCLCLRFLTFGCLQEGCARCLKLAQGKLVVELVIAPVNIECLEACRSREKNIPYC